MSTVSTTPVPAGWYPDPQGSFQQRWWNGTSWTNEFAQYRPTLNYTPAVQLAVDQASPAQLEAAAQVAAAQSAYAAARMAEAQSRYGSPGGVQTLAPVQTQAALTQTALTQTALPTRAESIQAELAQAELTHSAPVQAAASSPLPAQAPAWAPAAPLIAEPAAVATAAFAPAVVQPVPATQTVTYAPIPQFPGASPSASSAALVSSNPSAIQQPARPVNPSILEDYQPFGMIPQVRRGVRDRPVVRHTAAAFLLALAPAVIVAAALALAYFLPAFYTLFAIGGLGVLLLVALIGLAAADRRRLIDAGHESSAPAVLAVIPPLYLVARSVVVSRETGRGAPLPVLLSVLVLAAIGAALVLEPSILELLTTVR